MENGKRTLRFSPKMITTILASLRTSLLPPPFKINAKTIVQCAVVSSIKTHKIKQVFK